MHKLVFLVFGCSVFFSGFVLCDPVLEEWAFIKNDICLGPDCNHKDHVPNAKNDSTVKRLLPKNTNVENSYQDIFELWKEMPFFILQNASNISPQCNLAVDSLIENAKKLKNNALKILDANAKLSSGILRGNVNQYGDFDECLSAINAQYCLAEIDIKSFWTGPYTPFKNSIHSYFAIKETFDDPKHRVPGFTMIRWGFCIPSACNSVDVENALEEKLGVKSQIRPSMCQKSTILNNTTNYQHSFGEIIAKSILLLICLITIIATIMNDTLSATKNTFMRLLTCFSVQKNWNTLTKVENKNKAIGTVHGFRALAALGLIMAHKTMALFYNPYMNRSVMSANCAMSWSVIGRTAIVFTDVFMLFSGLLNAKSLLSELERTKSMNFKDKLITRIFRISPNIIAVILFCTYVLPSLGSGPLWPLVVNHHSTLCKNYMWRNILYVHNYFGFENMCLTHTHQVGIDMQLFLSTPIFVFVLWKFKTMGLWFIGVTTALSTILRFYITWQYSLSHVVYFGIPISRMFNTANLSYILPTHRSTIYLLGVYLAYLLRYKKNISLSRVQLTFLWPVFIIIGLLAWLGPYHMGQHNFVYNKLEAALYGSLSPIFIGLSIGWIVYATERGWAGWFGDILSWNKFEYFTRISYAVYLVQFPIFFYNVGLTRHVDEYRPQMMLQIPETLFILTVSIMLTLFIELPFQNVKKVLFDKNVNMEHDNKQTDKNYNVTNKKIS